MVEEYMQLGSQAVYLMALDLLTQLVVIGLLMVLIIVLVAKP